MPNPVTGQPYAWENAGNTTNSTAMFNPSQMNTPFQAPQASPFGVSDFSAQPPNFLDPTQQATTQSASLGLSGATPAAGGTNFLGSDGWGAPALQGASALVNSFLGFQNLGVAKDQLAFQEDAFNKNFGAQQDQLDQYYTDRSAARTAAGV